MHRYKLSLDFVYEFRKLKKIFLVKQKIKNKKKQSFIMSKANITKLVFNSFI